MNEERIFCQLSVACFDYSKKSNAVIWIHASWSGQSLSLRKKVLAVADDVAPDKLDLVELNHDSLDYDWFKRTFEVQFPPQGQGDVLWVRDGKILHADTNCYWRPRSFFQNRLNEVLEP